MGFPALPPANLHFCTFSAYSFFVQQVYFTSLPFMSHVDRPARIPLAKSCAVGYITNNLIKLRFLFIFSYS